jgi:hypothetical protein
MMLVGQRPPGSVEPSDRQDGTAEIVVGVGQQEGDGTEHADLRSGAAYPLSITRKPWRTTTVTGVG